MGLTTVLLSPARAALIDRFGPRRALSPLALAHALLLAALAVAATGTAPRCPCSCSSPGRRAR
ncbi:hypothetical protein O1L60_32050 [Streptomyces diastatochromogenes]|nr:hypothetical protein [Streptomyces diastatochromogenes]